MTLTRILTAASFAALISGGAAMAQTTDDNDYANQPPPAATEQLPVRDTDAMIPTAPSVSTAAMPASTLAPDNLPGTVTTRLVTNGPVPDTAENRARFGGPMSRAGKHTTPAGN